uniref:Uncharacterized protein n=1 Tax=Arundo donax TaxID=35708 RepID=A0A0A9ATB0_ARUDO
MLGLVRHVLSHNRKMIFAWLRMEMVEELKISTHSSFGVIFVTYVQLDHWR